MKYYLRSKYIFYILIFYLVFAPGELFAQCPTGVTQAAVCSGDSSQITVTSGTNFIMGTTYKVKYKINLKYDSIKKVSPATGMTLSFKILLTYADSGETLTIDSIYNGFYCTGTSPNVKLVVDPLPTVTASPTSVSICTGSSTGLTASGNSTTYTWSPSTGLNQTTGTSVTANPMATTTYTVTGKITSTGCTNTATSIVTVNPLPTVTASPTSVSICTGSSTGLTASGNSTTYTWSPSAGLNQTTGSSVTANPTATTTYTVTGKITITGCTNTATSIVTVNPLPTVTASPITVSICTGSSTGLTASGNSATYTWSPSAGLNPTTGSSVTANPTVTTTYTVTGKITITGCTNTATSIVTVNPLPTVTASPTTVSICTGNSTGLTASGNSTTYTWSPSAGLNPTTGSSVTANPTVTTTYTVTGKITITGCTNTATSIVTVNPLPTVTASPTTVSICTGNSTGLTASGNSTTYTWSPSTGLNPTTGSSVTANPTATTTYTVTGKITITGCTNTATSVVTVNPNPTITAISPSIHICNDSCTTLTATGSGGSGSYIYTWSPSSGLSATTGSSVTACSPGTTIYTAKVTDGNGCKGDSTVKVSVKHIPNVTANPPSKTICSHTLITITLNSTGNGVGAGTTYMWSIIPNGIVGADTGSGNSIMQTLSDTFNAPFQVSYIITPSDSGCPGTMLTDIITVNPILHDTATPTSQVRCSGVPTNILLTSNVGSTTFSWNVPVYTSDSISGGYGNTSDSIVQELSNNGVTPGSAYYTIIPTANGCNGDTITDTIIVNPLPIITATPTDTTICNGKTINIILNPNIATTFNWVPTSNKGDTIRGNVNGTGSPINQTLTNNGNSFYTFVDTVTGLDSFKCTSTINVTVTVNPVPKVTASPSPIYVCGSDSIERIVWTINKDTGHIKNSWTAIYSSPLVVEGEVTGSTDSTFYIIPHWVTNSDDTPHELIYIDSANFKYGGCSCYSKIDSDIVTVYPRPNTLPILTGKDTTICAGSNVVYFSLKGDASDSLYNWYSADDSVQIYGSNTNPYCSVEFPPNSDSTTLHIYVQIINKYVYSCDTIESITVNVNDALTSPPVYIYYYSVYGQLICYPDSINRVTSYQWGYDSSNYIPVTLSNQTSQSYYVGADPLNQNNRYYWCIVTYNNRCPTKTYYNHPPEIQSGINKPNNFTASSLLIYPNPNNGEFKLGIPYVDGGFIRILNYCGQIVYSQNLGTGNIFDLNIHPAPGIYILQYFNKNENSLISSKFIILN